MEFVTGHKKVSGSRNCRAGLLWVHCLVLLIPGAFGEGTSSQFLNVKDYFKEAEQFFREKNCTVKKVVYPNDARIQERALMLRDQWEAFVKENSERASSHRSEHYWVAHSLGGLDARYALKTLNVKNVDALATLSTPHHGAKLADWAQDQIASKGIWFYLLKWGGYDLSLLRFVGDLTPSVITKAQDKIAAVSGVRYGSAVLNCEKHCGWSFRILKWITGLQSGDGIVEKDTQRFGESLGEFDLDHLSAINSAAINSAGINADSATASERKRLYEAIWRWFHS